VNTPDREDALDTFVDAWGAVGPLFGMSTSVARVHGLLIASKRPWCLDDIAERLGISKSNVSGCLKELRGYGVLRRVVERGDRREHFTSESDVWKMLLDIVRERKKRAIDPVVTAVRHAIETASSHPEGLAIDRLEQMDRMLATFDRIGSRVLATAERAKALIALLSGEP
jgi:DNA-binding transcriptional regulator GbsR (MarR family)